MVIPGRRVVCHRQPTTSPPDPVLKKKNVILRLKNFFYKIDSNRTVNTIKQIHKRKYLHESVSDSIVSKLGQSSSMCLIVSEREQDWHAGDSSAEPVSQ